MTPLRLRMIEDMQIRNLALQTQKSYIEQVARFARHFARSPEHLGRCCMDPRCGWLLEPGRRRWIPAIVGKPRAVQTPRRAPPSHREASPRYRTGRIRHGAETARQPDRLKPLTR